MRCWLSLRRCCSPREIGCEFPGPELSIFVNLDYVVGYSIGSGGGYTLVLTTGEDVIVSGRDGEANAKIKEFGFP